MSPTSTSAEHDASTWLRVAGAEELRHRRVGRRQHQLGRRRRGACPSVPVPLQAEVGATWQLPRANIPSKLLFRPAHHHLCRDPTARVPAGRSVLWTHERNATSVAINTDWCGGLRRPGTAALSIQPPPEDKSSGATEQWGNIAEGQQCSGATPRSEAAGRRDTRAMA